MDKSVLFAKWLARVCVGFLDKHKRAIEDGRTGSDDSCFQEFVNIVYCYLFEVVWKSVLVNGDYAIGVSHANLMRKGRAVSKIQIMRAEYIRVFVQKGRIAGSERRRYVRQVNQFDVCLLYTSPSPRD